MGMVRAAVGCVVAVLLVLACCVSAQPFCGKQDNNGKTLVDLSLLREKGPFPGIKDPGDPRYLYAVAFCENTEHPCGRGTSLNDAVTQYPDFSGGNCYTCGMWDSATTINFINPNAQDAGVRIRYDNGHPYNHVNQTRTAVIDVLCNPNYADQPQIKFIGEGTYEGLEEIYYFTAESKAGCLVPGPSPDNGGGGGGGLSGGLIFIIVLVCLLVVYLAVGVTIQLARGARGAEAIPNYSFWKDFFSAVGDGVALVFCCRTPSPASYSSTDAAGSSHGYSSSAPSKGAESYQNI